MPSAGDGLAWDETIATDAGLVSDTGLEFREVKKAVRIRLNKEHVALATASAGGEHKPGSAKAYYATSFPSKRPDGTTDFTTDDSGRLFVKSDTSVLYYYDFPSATFVPVTVGDSVVTIAKVGVGTFQQGIAYCKYQDQKTNGTAGGTFTTGSWQTRTLNTEVFDANTLGSLSANRVTLAAGVYRFRATAPAFKVDAHQLRLFNITDNTSIQYGQNAYASSNDECVTYAEVSGEFTLTGSKALELQHGCGTTRSTNGYGTSGSLGVLEVYAVLEIWKLK